MKPRPPKIGAATFKGARPKFGIGIGIGALLVLGTQLSGSDSAFALVIGGGAGMALGLTRRSVAEKLDDETPGEVEAEEFPR